MDFSRDHVCETSVASKSKIRYIATSEKEDEDKTLDDRLIDAANRAATYMMLGPVDNPDPRQVDASLYLDRMTPQSETIQPNDLVVIFESFDNLNFVYAKPKDIFSNRNGNFHHDDFIGKPFGCKLRSRNNRGYGFCFLLKPTPELWARSLNHRTQIVHELDASMIVFYLQLKPNMVVCETGTGSGAMSHAILRTIAPKGKLHTFEFNQVRADQARQEFAKNGLSHLVTVHHRDVCGKAPVTLSNDGATKTTTTSKQESSTTQGGFGLPGQSVSAVFLDLPEPWLAIPHAAFTLKANGRIASYSPCMEQTQRTVVAMQNAGFHSIKTMEFRLRENYVDEVEYELPPKEKRPRVEPHNYLMTMAAEAAAATAGSGGEDTGAEADNEKSEVSETEADQLSLATAGTAEEMAAMDTAVAHLHEGGGMVPVPTKASVINNPTTPITTNTPATAGGSNANSGKRKKMLVARPFVTMRGHTAFLTFATAGNIPQPDPNRTSALVSS